MLFQEQDYTPFLYVCIYFSQYKDIFHNKHEIKTVPNHIRNGNAKRIRSIVTPWYILRVCL